MNKLFIVDFVIFGTGGKIKILISEEFVVDNGSKLKLPILTFTLLLDVDLKHEIIFESPMSYIMLFSISILIYQNWLLIYKIKKNFKYVCLIHRNIFMNQTYLKNVYFIHK